jgi:hypothetical protein
MTRLEIFKGHWKLLGIKDLKALKDNIKAIFARHEHQSDALISIYRMVLPDWDRIETIEGFPEAGKDLWTFICRQFIEFDQEHHPDVFNGGIWMNNGFSSNNHLEPWEISFENCKVIMS